MNENRIGIIGGSGLYDMDELKITEQIRVDTPFGAPSDRFVLGELSGRKVVFLPRHGKGHRLLPSEIPFRANIYGMKKLGVGRIVSVSSVGSMKEGFHPRDILIPDQFIDRTHGREDTFFGDGIVAHIGFSDPVCPNLNRTLVNAASHCEATVHSGGTYICIEGPAFSTRAESRLYRQWGVDVIGMTNYQEARLAREAEICYATIACITDYDCWHDSEAAVSVEMLIENLKANTAMAKKILSRAVPVMEDTKKCLCTDALRSAILTPEKAIPKETFERLSLIISGRLGEKADKK